MYIKQKTIANIELQYLIRRYIHIIGRYQAIYRYLKEEFESMLSIANNDSVQN